MDLSPGWDSPPFCQNVCLALEGRFDVAGFEEATIAIPALVADFKAKPFERLQGKCYDKLCDVLYEGSRHWDILICRRMADLGRDIQNARALAPHTATPATLTKKINPLLWPGWLGWPICPDQDCDLCAQSSPKWWAT